MQKLGRGEGGVETRSTMVHVKMVNKERSVVDLDIWIFSHGRFCDVAYNAHKLYWIFASHQFTKDRQIEL